MRRQKPLCARSVDGLEPADLLVANPINKAAYRQCNVIEHKIGRMEIWKRTALQGLVGSGLLLELQFDVVIVVRNQKERRIHDRAILCG